MPAFPTIPISAIALSTLAFSTGALAAGAFPSVLSDNPTGFADAFYVGAPDDSFRGLGGQSVTYDFGAALVVNRPGLVDLNVYEYDISNVEFHLMTVQVSLDGVSYVDIKASEQSVVDLAGDQAHGATRFARSYDLGGLAQARYVRIVGLGNGNAGPTNGFDLDAIGAHEVLAVVPEPTTAALFLAGLLGMAMHSRRRPAG